MFCLSKVKEEREKRASAAAFSLSKAFHGVLMQPEPLLGDICCDEAPIRHPTGKELD